MSDFYTEHRRSADQRSQDRKTWMTLAGSSLAFAGAFVLTIAMFG